MQDVNIEITPQSEEYISKAASPPSQSWDWEGWNRVIESNGYYREWDNDRYVDSYMTEEMYDTTNDRVHLSAFLMDKTSDNMLRIDWVCKNGVISLIHGMTELGFVPLGRPLAWKHDGNKIQIRWGVNKGSELVDQLWTENISKAEPGAGLSIGGQNLEKSCMGYGPNRKCDITKVDIWEIAWTPDPANEGAVNTFVNKMAKSRFPETGEPRSDIERLKEHFGEDWEEHSIEELPERGTGRKQVQKSVEKRGNQWCVVHCHGPDKGESIKCFDSKEEANKMHAAIQANKSKAINALYNYINDNNISSLNAMDAIKSCNYCNTFVKNYDDNITKSINSLQSIINEIINKGNVCQCVECGFSNLMDQCGFETCPVCGGDMHTMVRPAFRSKDNMEKDRHYLKPGEEAPKGAQVHQGEKGGRYYESGSSAAGYKGAMSDKEIESTDDRIADAIININNNKPKAAYNILRQLGKQLRDKDIPEDLKRKFIAARKKFQEENPDMDLNKSESFESLKKEGYEMPEDEEKKKEEDKVDKAEEEQPPSKPEKKEEDKEEDEDEEMTVKALTKAVKGLAKSVEEITKNVESHALMFKDISAKLTKGDTEPDEDTNQIPEHVDKPTETVAPGEDMSFKAKVEGEVDSILKAKYGIEKGSPAIQPKYSFTGPAGIDKTDKSKKSVQDILVAKLKEGLGQDA